MHLKQLHHLRCKHAPQTIAILKGQIFTYKYNHFFKLLYWYMCLMGGNINIEVQTFTYNVLVECKWLSKGAAIGTEGVQI